MTTKSTGFPLSMWASRSPAAVFFLVGTAMLFGVASYFSLPAQEDPEILVREAIVQTAHPGLTAEEVELLITQPLEEGLLSIAELKEIKSTSRDGLSIIHALVEDQFTELDIIWEELAETVAEVAPELPDGTAPPVVIDDFGDVGVFTLALYGQDFTHAELTDFAEHIRSRLIGVKGTKKIELLGAQEQRLYVELDNTTASQLGVSLEAVHQAVAQENAILSGGTVDLGPQGVLVDPAFPGDVAERVSDTLIPLENGVTVRLGEIARVHLGYEDPPQRKVYYNGEEALMLSIAMQSDQSAINYTARMNEQINAVSQTLPVGLTLSRLTVQGEQVATAVYGVSRNILETLTIVLAIVILFLGWRTGLIVGAIVPAVVLATLAVMGLFELPLERMSLATLVISLGLLVDNGIVIAEDFKRRLEDTGDRDTALRETSSELAFPLLSSSLTTIVVFLPLLIMDTEASEYTRSITYVVLISLGVSWFFAMTVTTTLCHRLLPDPATNQGESREHPGLMRRIFRCLDRGYEVILGTILRHRWAYLGLMGLLFCFGGWLMGLVPKKFFPDSDRAQILIYADLPVGVTSRATDQAVQEMMRLIGEKEKFPDFIDYAAYVGFGGPRFVLSLNPVDPSPHSAFLMINAKDRTAAEAALPRLRDAFRVALPEVNARVSRMFLGPADPNVIQLQIKGPDADYLMEKAAGLEEILLSLDGTIDVWSDWHGRTKRLKLEVDRHRAAAAGVTATDVANALTNRVTGEEVTSLQSGDDLVPIVLRGQTAERNSLDRLGALMVFPANGGPGVPLSQVADWQYETGLGVIAREDLIRTITVEARNLQLTPEDMQPLLQGPLEEFSASLAPGHHAEFDGILDETVESNAALAATGPLVLFLIVLLLILQFGGYRRPAVILLSLPFVVIGASIGLVLMQAEFGFMVILGLYALMGIIINNSIVLIDRSDIERRLEPDSNTHMLAVIRACKRRLRPILMTTITTVAGLLPLIISQDVLFYGMASAMAFGLFIGTLLVSLGLTPALYTLFLGIKPMKGKTFDKVDTLTFSELKAPSHISPSSSPQINPVLNGHHRQPVQEKEVAR